MRGARLALVCTGAFFLASVASAQDPYRDFRVPEARSFTWLVSGNGRWSGSTSAFPAGNSENRVSQGDARSVARRHAESEAFTSDLFVQALGTWNTNQYTGRAPIFGGQETQEYLYTSDRYEATAAASTTRYLGHSGWGIDAALAASYGYMRFANASGYILDFGSTVSESRYDSQNHVYSGSASALLGPGYGRVRDVTGVFDMQVLEQRLEATGRLQHPISPAARQRLAELFSVSGDFQAAHDRPDRYLWREVERLLREDGAVAEGTFDAWSLTKALEPATLSIAVTRLAGWRVTGAYELFAERGHLDSETQSTFAAYSGGILTSVSSSEDASRRSLDETRGFGTLDATWHRPLGMRWQVDAGGTGRYGDGPRRQLLLSGALSLTNVLADRWVATVTASEVTSTQVVEGVRTSPAWTVRGNGQLSYFFEDSWSISAGVNHEQARPLFNDGVNPSVPLGYFRQTQVVFGLTYRPVGRFEAPGLHVSERLAPGGI